jgi:hypothetical protein
MARASGGRLSQRCAGSGGSVLMQVKEAATRVLAIPDREVHTP